MIELKNLTKKFSEITLFQNINLKIENGDLLYIKGVNGCGKSTLLYIIAGLADPTSGEVINKECKNIGALIENPAFIEKESAEFNLKFLYNLKNNYDRDKVKRLMDYFDLDIEAKTPVKKYSIGMKQKLGIIQAIMEDQDFILLDEPSRGLDKSSSRKFIELIEKLHKDGKTIVICAHDGVDDIKFTKIWEFDDRTIKEVYNERNMK